MLKKYKLLRYVSFCLGEKKKKDFIPGLIKPILEMTLVPEPGKLLVLLLCICQYSMYVRMCDGDAHWVFVLKQTK